MKRAKARHAQELDALRTEANERIRALAKSEAAAHRDVDLLRDVLVLAEINTSALMAEVQRLRERVRNLGSTIAEMQRWN